MKVYAIYRLQICFLSDIDECALNYCDQRCTNLVGNYSCSCYDGYRLENDTTCIAEGQLDYGAI